MLCFRIQRDGTCSCHEVRQALFDGIQLLATSPLLFFQKYSGTRDTCATHFLAPYHVLLSVDITDSSRFLRISTGGAYLNQVSHFNLTEVHMTTEKHSRNVLNWWYNFLFINLNR